MKTVIVKLKLKNREDFVKMLSDISMDFGDIYWQHDRIYAPRGYKKGDNYPTVKVRTEMKAVDKPARYSIILKRHIEDSGIDIVNGTRVKDYTESVNILHQLGFNKVGEVSRQRQELAMGENIKIYLDKVEGLAGYYARIETDLADGDDIEEVREDLVKTFEVLGQKRGDLVKEMYWEMGE
jgi:predicted adenylyl cyclase CyaB